jgi:general secretion pathway protein G
VRTLCGYGLLGLLVVAPSRAVVSSQASPAVALIEAKEAALKDALFQMRDAIDRYYTDKKQYPTALDSLITAKYLGRIPADPFTNSARSWRIIRSRPDRTHPTVTPGLYDVKSASTAKALDGTKYSEW